MNFGNDSTLTRLATKKQPEKAETFTQFPREPINSTGQNEKEMRAGHPAADSQPTPKTIDSNKTMQIKGGEERQNTEQ
ncbi:hypothetical protein ACFWPK_08955 [Nocardia sp. NPDC058519]|uniref:hypothetical protein n=1 Tax=Nocardia sp. NPDC058519 TaxID=3346535 RepID=UPI00364B9E85